jgi:ABC-type transporter Mla subunit MlaD
MNRQGVVGLFSILAIFGLFVMFWFITNQGSKLGGYRMGVRFASAAGLRPGSQVFESGLAIGTVDKIDLAPDYTVDVILAIKGTIPALSVFPGSAPPGGYDIPKGSKFIIQAPLTGDSSVIIVPPPPAEAASGGTWPHEVLARDQQPQGGASASFSDVLQQGGQTLSEMQRRLPALFDGLQSAVNNANAMAIHGNELTQHLSTRMDSITGSLQAALDQAGGNIVAMTRDFRDTAHSNRGRIDTLLARLDSTALSLNQAVDSMRDLAADRELHADLLETTRNIANATATLANMAADARQVSGNPQTQAQLRDTVANIDAVMQKANSLLAGLGGTSTVYGVDQGATPAPGETLPPAAPVPGGPTVANPAQRPSLNKFVKQLVGFQVRISELNPAPANGFASPALGPGRGPQSDFNVLFLPHASTTFFAGANNLGPAGSTSGPTTYNFALLSTVAPGLRAGGGVLYSSLGLMSQYMPPSNKGLGFTGYVYDPQHPTIDAYGMLPVSPTVSIFGGERDVLHSGRRTVFGLQLDF